MTADAGSCSYERRNTGRSETVEGTQSPQDIVADVDGVLEAMGEDGPFVLLGASFGGLVSGAYAGSARSGRRSDLNVIGAVRPAALTGTKSIANDVAKRGVPWLGTRFAGLF